MSRFLVLFFFLLEPKIRLKCSRNIVEGGISDWEISKGFKKDKRVSKTWLENRNPAKEIEGWELIKEGTQWRQIQNSLALVTKFFVG